MSCWQPPGLRGLSSLIMPGSWRWRQVGGWGGNEEDVEDRMPPQSAPCRETHAAVSSRVLVVTSESQQAQRRSASTGENVWSHDLHGGKLITVCNLFNYSLL